MPDHYLNLYICAPENPNYSRLAGRVRDKQTALNPMVDVTVKICGTCQTPFECSSKCWCSDFPAILPLNTQEGCLCKSCLTKSIKEKIAEFMVDLTPGKIEAIQALGKPKKFIEGIDYNKNESGAWVFTGWYLLRQGGCCGNGCTNCPYPADLKNK